MEPQNQTPQPNFSPQNAPAPPSMQAPTPPVYAAPSEPRKSSGLAIASLVLSIVGLLTAWILGLGILLAILAVVFAIIALAKNHGGKGLSIAGLVIGGVTILIGGVILLISLAAIGGIQDRAVSSQNESSARMLQKKAELYNLENGSYAANNYPTYQEFISSEIAGVVLDAETLEMIHDGDESSVSANRPIAYDGCSYGATIYYFDATADSVESILLGEPDRC